MKTGVVIVGGGPGGSACAMWLARQGITSVIVEQEPFPRYHIGESMTGEAGGIDRDGLFEGVVGGLQGSTQRERVETGGDACEELGIGNVLGEVVVDSGDVAALVVDAGPARGEHDDVGVDDAAAAQRFSQRDPVHDGHLPIGDEKRIPLLIEQLERLLAVARARDLETGGPYAIGHELQLRFRSSRDELRIEQASLRGPDTNFDIAGSIRFTGSRAVSLRLSGALNLRLASTFFPQLAARGPAQINASFEGTLDRPIITGKLRVENASARYAEFPAGLSGIYGDFVFDATRLLFDNVVAETGGGKLYVSGTVHYGESPLRYDITARADRVRLRYPEGISWLAGGTLRLTGTPNGGILSGRVSVQRLVMTQGIDIASLALAAREGIAAPTTTSPFLRNLQFNIEASTTPDSRMEWPGAEFETEADLRVRGTWEHPILLGHVRLISGELNFRGTRYRVTRGELNFSNPFRLVPTLNVEATTTIQQYEITLNFSGPADKLTLAYRSDPPLPANDIITLLALGRTGEETELRSSATQGPSSGASALLSEAISSQLGGRLERLFGITRLRVDPILAGTGSTGSEQNAAARVTVEQRLTRDLTVTYITNVTSTQQQVIQVEYNVNRNVSIVALRDQNGTFGLDIKFTKRFE